MLMRRAGDNQPRTYGIAATRRSQERIERSAGQEEPGIRGSGATTHMTKRQSR